MYRLIWIFWKNYMISNIKECAIFPKSIKIGSTKIAVTELAKLAKI